MSTPHTSTPVRHYAEDRLVDCHCDRRLGLPLLHYGRWSEVQFARCCGCGTVQAFIPVGDDPRELDRSGANRVVDIHEDVARWLAQWPLLIEHGTDPVGPSWLPAGTQAAHADALRAEADRVRDGDALRSPAQRLRSAGFPADTPPLVNDRQLHAAIHAMDRVRCALLGELPDDPLRLLSLIDDRYPERLVALERLLHHPERDPVLQRLPLADANAPWTAMLLLLHWSRANEDPWAHYLERLSDHPLTPIDGVDGLVQESFHLCGLIEAVSRSNAPRPLMRTCLRHLLERSAPLDDRLLELLNTLLHPDTPNP